MANSSSVNAPQFSFWNQSFMGTKLELLEDVETEEFLFGSEADTTLEKINENMSIVKSNELISNTNKALKNDLTSKTLASSSSRLGEIEESTQDAHGSSDKFMGRNSPMRNHEDRTAQYSLTGRFYEEPGSAKYSNRNEIKLEGDLSHQCNKNFRAGDKVEAKTDEEGLYGAWFSGVIQDVQGQYALVQFDDILNDDGKHPLKEWYPVSHPWTVPSTLDDKSTNKTRRSREKVFHRYLRPLSEVLSYGVEYDKPGEEEHQGKLMIGSQVEVLYEEGWWEAIVTSVHDLEASVYYPGTNENATADISNIRPALICVNGAWTVNNQLQPIMNAGKKVTSREKIVPTRALSSNTKVISKKRGRSRTTVLPNPLKNTEGKEILEEKKVKKQATVAKGFSKGKNYSRNLTYGNARNGL